MGKSPPKQRQHSFYERFGKAKEARVVRTMHVPIHVGLVPAEHYSPRCWWQEGEVHRIYRLVKRWDDEFHNRWYRVKTEEGTFDLYEHRRWLSREEHRFRSYWFLAAQIEMVPVRHALRAEELLLGGATASAATRGAKGDTTRTGRGDTPSRRR